MFPAARFPEVLVGLGPLRDDAAVYRINDETALVATLDFFTPVVDDPYQYGAVAAANALSDVYAMGGRPALALNISCLSRCLPAEIVAEILRGGADKVREADAVLVGGHSVDDREPKYGLVALGFVHPQRILTKAGARPGDILVLTKPLGVGMITTAHKGDQAEAEHMRGAVDSMLRLNRAAAEILQSVETHACTDVTGFALLGHACEMAEQSHVRLRMRAAAIPFLPGAEEYAGMWLFPGGTGNNWQAFASHVRFEEEIREEMRRLLLTPETSGGLLAAVAPGELDNLRDRFREAGEQLWVIGEVLSDGEPGQIEVTAGSGS
jgi:selenide,water dikinase